MAKATRTRPASADALATIPPEVSTAGTTTLAERRARMLAGDGNGNQADRSPEPVDRLDDADEIDDEDAGIFTADQRYDSRSSRNGRRSTG
jgi:hypothetical protein